KPTATTVTNASNILRMTISLVFKRTRVVYVRLVFKFVAFSIGRIRTRRANRKKPRAAPRFTAEFAHRAEFAGMPASAGALEMTSGEISFRRREARGRPRRRLRGDVAWVAQTTPIVWVPQGPEEH